MDNAVRPALDSEAPIHVLIVDDDLDEALKIQRLLEAAQGLEFEVTRATRVEEGLQLLRETEFTAVLLDLGLEETQGIDTLAPARVAAASVPVVAMGSDDDEDLALRAHRYGAQDYLVKAECDSRSLVRTLRHAIERHQILRDLARSRRYEHYLATHDSLTGLPNRLALMDQLRRSVATAARTDSQVGLLFLDLDRFKNINDSLGHGTGDELLRIVARRLSTLLRTSDMIARLGGDEFVIMLQGVTRDQDPATVAQKVTHSMMTPCVLDSREYHVTTSIGIAVFPADGEDAEELLRNADTAMYHAKAGGPNRFSYFSQSLNESVTKRLDIENGLQDALAQGDFSLHFQPQIDTGLAAVTGAEALLRWRHPERGMVSPSEFIPYAEEAGLMGPIGLWVLQAACERAAGWPLLHGHALRVSVNVSTRQLCDESFPDAVTRILRETDLDPGRLELEITEHSVLQETGATLAAITYLRGLGVRVVIDDFGTGYSALSALKQLPIDGIKIDRSFVSEVPHSEPDTTIVRGLVTIAQGLGLSVTAEGVETIEQLGALNGFGVRHIQGYLFAKPVNAHEFNAQIEGGAEQWTDRVPLP